MLANRIQSASSLLFQSQFGFATKNLKQIKIRMKAVESIKKITKVHNPQRRPWRWWQPQRWSRTSVDSKRPSTTAWGQSSASSKIRLTLPKRNLISPLRSGCLCPSPLIRVSAEESTPTSSERSKPWSKPTAAPTKSSWSGTRAQWPSAEPWPTFWTQQSPTSTPPWTSPQVQMT